MKASDFMRIKKWNEEIYGEKIIKNSFEKTRKTLGCTMDYVCVNP